MIVAAKLLTGLFSQSRAWLILTELNIATTKNNTRNLDNQTIKVTMNLRPA